MRSISIERAAEETRIRRDFLIKMEADEFTFLAPAYVRGFLRSYARFLHIDPAPLTEEFDRRFARDDGAHLAAIRQQELVRGASTGSRWMMAAIGAGVILLVLAVVASFAGPERPERERSAGLLGRSGDARKSERPRHGGARGAIDFREGVRLKVAATSARCWVAVDADGRSVYRGILEVGASRSFRAARRMSLVLGAPWGVELTVNGRKLGTADGDEPLVLRLPRDIKSLL